MAPFSLSVLVATVVNINTARSGDNDMELFFRKCHRAFIYFYTCNKCCLVAFDCLLLLRYRFDSTKLKEVLKKALYEENA